MHFFIDKIHNDLLVIEREICYHKNISTSQRLYQLILDSRYNPVTVSQRGILDGEKG